MTKYTIPTSNPRTYYVDCKLSERDCHRWKAIQASSIKEAQKECLRLHGSPKHYYRAYVARNLGGMVMDVFETLSIKLSPRDSWFNPL